MISAVLRFLQRALPHFMYYRLIGAWNTDGLQKHFFNTSWLAIGRVVTLGVSFLTIAIVARYLGPENFGKLSYAQSFVALFSVLASLGIDQVIYRNLIREPEKEAAWLGSAIAAKAFLGSLTLAVTIVSAFFLNAEPLLTAMITLVALSFIFQPLGTIGHYFNAIVKAKYGAYVTITIALAIPLLKLAVIYFDKGVLYFAALVTFEALLYGLCNLALYILVLKRTPLAWRASLAHIRSLLYDSWPLALASFSGYLYGRIDQIMIQQFIDSTAVGLYDVAVRLTELMGFLPGIIITALLPAIIGSRETDATEYRKRWRALTVLCLLISLSSAIALFLLAPRIVGLLFGEAFLGAAAVLRVYVWSTIGTVGIILMQHFFIAEQASLRFLVFSIAGALMNIALNLLLIPSFGVFGAAYATLLTLCGIITIFIITERRRLSRVNS